MHKIEQILSDINGATFLGIDSMTDVKLKGGKKNPLQGRVTKRQTGSSVMVFTNKNSNGYRNMVERRLAQEGKDPADFQLSPRTWGERLPNTPFVEHNGKKYLEVIFLRAGPVEYLVDGIVTPRSEIEGLEDPVVNPEGQGGLSEENRVQLRTFAFDSLTRITCDKQSHVL